MEHLPLLLDHAQGLPAVIVALGFAAPRVARGFAVVWGAIFGGDPTDSAE
jgi:hypothetical protein